MCFLEKLIGASLYANCGLTVSIQINKTKHFLKSQKLGATQCSLFDSPQREAQHKLKARSPYYTKREKKKKKEDMQSQLIRKLLLLCSTIFLTLASHLCLFWIIENLRNILIFPVHTQLRWVP